MVYHKHHKQRYGLWLVPLVSHFDAVLFTDSPVDERGRFIVYSDFANLGQPLVTWSMGSL